MVNEMRLTRTSNLTPQTVTLFAAQKDVPACYAVVVGVKIFLGIL
jgi:hypothetical protein